MSSDNPPSIPTYIFEIWKLEEIISKWKLLLPRITPFYALKAFAHPKMIQKIAHLDCHFDCASMGEIELVQSLCSQEIIYANCIRPIDHLQYAASHGIELYTFDCLDEAIRIKQYCPAAKLVMRISIDNPHSKCNFGEKFGVLEEDFSSMITALHKLNFHLHGLSFHVGSGNTDVHIFPTAIRKCYEVTQLLDYSLRLIDIGGGFIDDENFGTICEGINAALEQYFPVEGDSQLRIIAEPGRLFSEPLMTAEATVISKRIRKNRICYTINDSIYGIFYCCLNNYKIYNEKDIRIPGINNSHNNKTTDQTGNDDGNKSKKQEIVEKKLSMIFGQTCDSGDVISRDVLLPELEIGDKVQFLNMGAYSIDIACEFNGFKKGTNIFLEKPTV